MAMANGVTTTADAEMLAATAADLTAADAEMTAATAADLTVVDAEMTADVTVAEDAPHSSLIRP